MELTLQRDADLPLYRQIVNQIRDLIRSGALSPGYRLPTVRQLAADLGLTRLTVHSAYAELQAQGLIESHVGRGTFVAADAGRLTGGALPAEPPAPWVSQGVLAELLRADQHQNIISFAQAFPAPETYPLRELGQALQRATRKSDALGYGSIQGEATLREQIAGLLLDRGLAVPPEHILITAGAQQGIDLALRALVEPREVILVEEPTYPGVLELAAQRGQRIVGVAGDEQGLRLDALEAACKTYQPRLLYLVPTFGNPGGMTLAPERREPLLRLARDHRMLVVEDDVYGLLAYDDPATPPLKSLDRDGQVVYITSFSKPLAPALRLGALVASASLLPALAAAKQSSDLVGSTLLQRALADYLRRGFMASHLHLVRSLYRDHRDAMLAALERHLSGCSWTRPAGGLSLWVRLPKEIVERDFVADAFDQGVGVAPGRAFFPQPQPSGAMRLSFGMHPPERIEEGVATLGGVLHDHLQRRSQLFSLAGRAVGPLV